MIQIPTPRIPEDLAGETDGRRPGPDLPGKLDLLPRLNYLPLLVFRVPPVPHADEKKGPIRGKNLVPQRKKARFGYSHGGSRWFKSSTAHQ